MYQGLLLGFIFNLTNRYFLTTGESVTTKTVDATTNWCVIQHSTLTIWTARTWARIDTLLIDAGQITVAVTVDNALWSAVRCCSDHIVSTTTLGVVAYRLTYGIRSTRWRIARLRNLWLSWWDLNYDMVKVWVFSIVSTMYYVNSNI